MARASAWLHILLSLSLLSGGVDGEALAQGAGQTPPCLDPSHPDFGDRGRCPPVTERAPLVEGPSAQPVDISHLGAERGPLAPRMRLALGAGHSRLFGHLNEDYRGLVDVRASLGATWRLWGVDLVFHLIALDGAEPASLIGLRADVHRDLELLTRERVGVGLEVRAGSGFAHLGGGSGERSLPGGSVMAGLGLYVELRGRDGFKFTRLSVDGAQEWTWVRARDASQSTSGSLLRLSASFTVSLNLAD